MINDWFRDLSFETNWETFQKLPRHPAYQYEFKNERCTISGRPVFYHAKRELSSSFEMDGKRAENQWEITPLAQTDLSELGQLFASAFSRTVPLIHLSEEQQLVAANGLLQRTQNGEDGPLVEAASLVVRKKQSEELLAAILITLVPSDDFTAFDPEQWSQQAPTNAVEMKWGQPHLTWVFVGPGVARQGFGEALLRTSAEQLLNLGFATLISTFLSGNQASLLWHWKMGFQLLSHVSSR